MLLIVKLKTVHVLRCTRYWSVTKGKIGELHWHLKASLSTTLHVNHMGKEDHEVAGAICKLADIVADTPVVL